MTTKAVTFLCDIEVHDKIQKLADDDFEGNFSLALRKILKDWKNAN